VERSRTAVQKERMSTARSAREITMVRRLQLARASGRNEEVRPPGRYEFPITRSADYETVEANELCTEGSEGWNNIRNSKRIGRGVPTEVFKRAAASVWS